MKLVLLISLVLVCQQKLQFYQAPNQLKELYNKGGMNYTMADFGVYQYNKQYTGKLVKAYPFDACLVQNISDYIIKSVYDSPFLVVERGGCDFLQKAKFAQHYGAKMMIVIDNIDEQTSLVTMDDNGQGYYDLNIPTIMISKKDGEQITNFLDVDINQYLKELKSKNLLENSPDLQSEQGTSHHSSYNIEKMDLVMTIEFEIQKLKDPFYEFFLTVSNRHSYRLVRQFYPYYLKLKKHIKFEPRYSLWQCMSCKISNFTSHSPDECVSRGRYCALASQLNQNIKGSDIVMEDLRQICIFQQDSEKWFQYLDMFDQMCTEVDDLHICGFELMGHLNMDQKKIDECINESFTGRKEHNDELDIDNDNQLLRKELIEYRKHGVYSTPSVYINGQEFRGKLNGIQIYNAICQSLQDPSVCDPDPTQSHQSQHEYILYFLLTYLPVMILMTLIAFYFHRSYIRIRISKEVNDQVNELLNQYSAYQENTNVEQL